MTRKFFEFEPMPTTLNGVSYRSRTEARWALFFDALQIRHQYEPRVFDLPSGRRYLPDFLLPDLQLYVEVKGVDALDEERDACFELWEITQRPVLLVVGPPQMDRLGEVWPQYEGRVWGRIEHCRGCAGGFVLPMRTTEWADDINGSLLLGTHVSCDTRDYEDFGCGPCAQAVRGSWAHKFDGVGP